MQNTVYRYRFVSDQKKSFKETEYSVKAKVWVYSGTAAWHFVTIPVLTSRKIRKKFGHAARGWGSLPVHVTLGKTTWTTSIFPDKKAGAYILPLKSDIRKKEAVGKGDLIKLNLCPKP